MENKKKKKQCGGSKSNAEFMQEQAKKKAEIGKTKFICFEEEPKW